MLAKQYIAKEDLEDLKRLKKSLLDDHMRVTCIGLYNAGKSKLLDCLIDDIDLQTFKVSDSRETVENKLVTIGNITFVDTPGLNVNDDDNNTALEAVVTSDLNLFVHNVNNGELDRYENSFFEMIAQKQSSDRADFIEKTIFALTRIDEIGDERDIRSNIARIKEQIKNHFEADTDISIISVSSNSYIDGKNENEEELIEESNILGLKNMIEMRIDDMQSTYRATKEIRIRKKTYQIISNLSFTLDLKKKELIEIQTAQQKRENSIREDLNLINQTLSAKYQKLER